ncbi:MAG: (2Fe-2S) ferredoxin domain-containing protein [Anaerococcus sp.]
MKIKVCTSGKCKKNGGKDLYKELNKLSKKVNKYIEKEGLDKKKLKVKKSSCQHNCKNAPSVTIKNKKLKEANIKQIEEKIIEKYDIPNDIVNL